MDKRPPWEPVGFTAKHGTQWGYKQGCRCVECKQAQRDYRRHRFERGNFKHGYIGYTLGCRCDLCRGAASAYHRERYARRKAAQP